jgi:hypothetical protein
MTTTTKSMLTDDLKNDARDCRGYVWTRDLLAANEESGLFADRLRRAIDRKLDEIDEALEPTEDYDTGFLAEPMSIDDAELMLHELMPFIDHLADEPYETVPGMPEDYKPRTYLRLAERYEWIAFDEIWMNKATD